MEAASSASAPSAQVVGNAFVEQYYHILHHSPELVYRFYLDSSILSRPDPDGLMTTVTTMKSINDKICSLEYKNYKAEIKTADAQESFKEGVVLLVTGCLTGKDNLRRKFTQTFFLAPQDKGYYVLNDVFRYIEESEPASSVDVVVGVGDTPSTTLTQDTDQAQVVDPPKVDLSTSPAEEIVTIEGEKVNDQRIDERPASHHRDTVMEVESHSSENHTLVAEDSFISASQDDAPKISYASIVSSQTKKGPTKVYVPAGTARRVYAKTEKPSVHPAQEGSSSEASEHHPPVHAPEVNETEDEAKGHSIYIRNLPLNATVAQLEAEFKQFGPIKPNGVQVRSKPQGFCFGFVEFQEFSSMQHAIKASPITIGDHQAAIEIKRTTTRVGSGRSHFPSSRGGFRNENFRGPGKFSSSWTYVRSDNFRGRGSFSGGRGSSEGYRGRGGRGPVLTLD